MPFKIGIRIGDSRIAVCVRLARPILSDQYEGHDYVITIGSMLVLIVVWLVRSSPRLAVSLIQVTSFSFAQAAFVLPLASLQPVAAQTPSTICVASVSGIFSVIVMLPF